MHVVDYHTLYKLTRNERTFDNWNECLRKKLGSG